MESQQQPVSGENPHKNVIDAINQKVNDAVLVIESRVHKLTIVVEGRHRDNRIHKTFYFNENSLIPAEIYSFFMQWATRMAAQCEILLDSEVKFVQLGNDIIQLDDFLKDYSQGSWPSIHYGDYEKVKALKKGSTAVITINNSIQSIKRIK
jgi:hypothetical protein